MVSLSSLRRETTINDYTFVVLFDQLSTLKKGCICSFFDFLFRKNTKICYSSKKKEVGATTIKLVSQRTKLTGHVNRFVQR